MRLRIAAVGLAAIVGLAGCDELDKKKSPTSATPASSTPAGSPPTSSTPTSTAPPELPPHGPVTVDVLVVARPWKPGSRSIDPAFVTALDAFAKAGPVRLLLADMIVIPDRMREAGFVGRDTALWYALSRSYAEFPWTPGSDPELQGLSQQRAEIAAWWQRYLDAVIGVMQQRPGLTVTLIVNDGLDRTGRTLGNFSRRAFPPGLSGRIDVGDTVPD